MTKNKPLPTNCPSCQSVLNVSSLKCLDCETVVSGLYELPTLTSLSKEDQFFILQFFKESGKLNVMAQQLGLSYPSVRNKLDDLIERIRVIETKHDESIK